MKTIHQSGKLYFFYRNGIKEKMVENVKLSLETLASSGYITIFINSLFLINFPFAVELIVLSEFTLRYSSLFCSLKMKNSKCKIKIVANIQIE